MKKILIFSLLVVICVVLIFFKENVNIEEEMYVVSHSEEREKETVQVEKNNNRESDKEDNRIENNYITIYVSGEVANPGIVTLENDKRLYDALQELGGATIEADLNRVNLAIKLEDGQHYIIPKIGEVYDNTTYNKTITNNDNSENNKININIADIKELEDLPGVGEATANKIVKYREENKRFNSVEEIKSVNGIGDKKYEEIKDLICVD